MSRGVLQGQLLWAIPEPAAGCISLGAPQMFFSPLFQLFENFYFGEVQLDSVRLSQRFSSDASGYYATSGQLMFWSGNAAAKAGSLCAEARVCQWNVFMGHEFWIGTWELQQECLLTPWKHIAAGKHGIPLELFLHILPALPSRETGILPPPFPTGNRNVAKVPVWYLCPVHFPIKQLEKLVQVAFGALLMFKHSFLSEEGSLFLK